MIVTSGALRSSLRPHKVNIVLGKVALVEDDVTLAGHHLLEAGRVEGSAPLGSFGPNMSLAAELLERGEKDVVLEYFELCSAFWPSEKLADWAAMVKGGRMPDFGGSVGAGLSPPRPPCSARSRRPWFDQRGTPQGRPLQAGPCWTSSSSTVVPCVRERLAGRPVAGPATNEGQDPEHRDKRQGGKRCTGLGLGEHRCQRDLPRRHVRVDNEHRNDLPVLQEIQ